MYARTAHLYDAIYLPMKDYESECMQISELIRRHHPDADSILDTGCGTGEHARILSENHHFQVTGIDLQKEFIEIARSKLPSGRFYTEDMCDFQLDRKFDAVLCLFSSIGYVKTLDNVVRSLTCFRRHLNPGGIILVEPWIEPDKWDPGHNFLSTVDEPGLKIARMSLSLKSGKTSIIQFKYLVGSPDGIQVFSEEHVLGLFTVEEMQNCFLNAGLTAEYDNAGITGRGLFIGRMS